MNSKLFILIYFFMCHLLCLASGELSELVIEYNSLAKKEIYVSITNNSENGYSAGITSINRGFMCQIRRGNAIVATLPSSIARAVKAPVQVAWNKGGKLTNIFKLDVLHLPPGEYELDIFWSSRNSSNILHSDANVENLNMILGDDGTLEIKSAHDTIVKPLEFDKFSSPHDELFGNMILTTPSLASVNLPLKRVSLAKKSPAPFTQTEQVKDSQHPFYAVLVAIFLIAIAISWMVNRKYKI